MSEPGAPVRMVDLAEQQEELGPALEEAALRVLRSGAWILSEEVSAFEEEWARACGTAHAVGVGSGTDALYLALRAAGVGPGDRVVVPAYTFIATYECVVRCGAEPLLADVLPETGGLDPASVRRVAQAAGGAQAVLAVHLYGIPCDTEALRQAVSPWDGVLVEDAAQAHLARGGETPVGGLGRAAAFSFYPTKNLPASGDAGAVTTNDDDLARHLLSLRNHGRDDRYRHTELGTNSRLDALQAALLRVRLGRLEEWTRARRRVAAWWEEALSRAAEELAEGVLSLPRAPENTCPAWHLYPLRVGRRQEARDALTAAGVEHGEHYPLPLHHQPAVRARLEGAPNLPASEAWAAEVITLPCHPHVPREGVERAARALVEALG